MPQPLASGKSKWLGRILHRLLSLSPWWPRPLRWVFLAVVQFDVSVGVETAFLDVGLMQVSHNNLTSVAPRS